MKLLRFLALPFLLLGVVALTGCPPTSTGGTGSAGPSGGKTYGKYTLHSIKYDNVDRGKAKANAADVLTQLQNNDKVALIGLWAYNPPSILAAVKGAGKEGKVQIVGFDEDEITLQGIKDGQIHATVVQDPYNFGYESAKMMVALVKDPKTGEVPASGTKYVPHRVVKKDNVEAFHAELKERKAVGSTAAPPDDGGNKIKVGFVSNNAEEFWSIAEAGTRAAAKDLGCQVLFRRPKAGTAAEQKTIIEDLLTQGVQAIAISVVDPVNQKDFLNSIADKIPLITQDNDAPDTKRRCYIGTNNYDAGKEVGKLVKEALPDGGTIAIFVGQPDPINAQERRQGVLDELAGEKDAKGK